MSLSRIRRHTLAGVIAIVSIALLAALGAACSGGGTDVEPEPDPDPGAAADPGIVEDPPGGAAQVTVQLSEWLVAPEPAEVDAGEVYFLAQNDGGEAHEMVLVRTDDAPEALPVEDGRVPEDEIDLVGEIEPFAAQSEASAVFDLEPGNYVLLCNITEEENGEIESHYQEGMYASFVVN